MLTNVKFVALAFISTSMILGAVGQIFIKKGLNALGGLDFSSGIVTTYLKIFLSPLVIIGICIYFVGVFFWLYGLSKVELSFAFPFVSVSYVLVFLLSWFFLGESIPVLRWIGLVTICCGVLLVGRS
jgi:drug/metabolite transporter (DMT)-like permease